MNEFEDKLHEDVHQFLLSMKEIDERLPKKRNFEAGILTDDPEMLQ